MMESVGIICGVVLGLFGSVFSIVQFFFQRQRDKGQEIRDRLAFLMQVIIDKDIPRESRQPFFDEYIAKGGNGTVVKFWLENK
ncbi:hypothetical protein AGMMS49940_19830 [Spirochaetia bacterium]|nr:hypothetical protein AGMMS49940_19830 [Spirochaetia bacterium]